MLIISITIFLFTDARLPFEIESPELQQIVKLEADFDSDSEGDFDSDFDLNDESNIGNIQPLSNAFDNAGHDLTKTNSFDLFANTTLPQGLSNFEPDDDLIDEIIENDSLDDSIQQALSKPLQEPQPLQVPQQQNRPHPTDILSHVDDKTESVNIDHLLRSYIPEEAENGTENIDEEEAFRSLLASTTENVFVHANPPRVRDSSVDDDLDEAMYRLARDFDENGGAHGDTNANAMPRASPHFQEFEIVPGSRRVVPILPPLSDNEAGRPDGQRKPRVRLTELPPREFTDAPITYQDNQAHSAINHLATTNTYRPHSTGGEAEKPSNQKQRSKSAARMLRMREQTTLTFEQEKSRAQLKAQAQAVIRAAGAQEEPPKPIELCEVM